MCEKFDAIRLIILSQFRKHVCELKIIADNITVTPLLFRIPTVRSFRDYNTVDVIMYCRTVDVKFEATNYPIFDMEGTICDFLSSKFVHFNIEIE